MTNKKWLESADPNINIRREKAKIYCDSIREKRRIWNKEWIQNNRDRYRVAKYRYRLKVKMRAMALYADPVRCQHCGFDKIDALCLDHVENNGAAHRKEINVKHRGCSPTAGTRIYEYIQKNGKVEGLQVLCANCNLMKQIKHQRSKSVKDAELLAQTEAMYGN